MMPARNLGRLSAPAALTCVVGCGFAFRHLQLRWGSTPEELGGRHPGDDFITHAGLQATRSITIHAPAEKVWPWLAQMGQRRGGPTATTSWRTSPVWTSIARTGYTLSGRTSKWGTRFIWHPRTPRTSRWGSLNREGRLSCAFPRVQHPAPSTSPGPSSSSQSQTEPPASLSVSGTPIGGGGPRSWSKPWKLPVSSCPCGCSTGSGAGPRQTLKGTSAPPKMKRRKTNPCAR